MNDVSSKKMSISVIIPTYNGAFYLDRLLSELKNQRDPAKEIIVIDSSSTDQSVKIAQRHGCLVTVIPKAQFNHGGTRNRAAEMATGDILVFMTQDALPADKHFLEKLIEPITKHHAQAAYARQIPYSNASDTERFTRIFNYPEMSHLRSKADIPQLGIKAFFFSNVASAFLNRVFKKIGGFADDLIMNEDMLMCAKMLYAGYRISYQADAQVYHSHSYSLTELFSRYFDHGVFLAASPDLFEDIPKAQEGKRLFIAQIRAMGNDRKWGALIQSLFESNAKYMGFLLGSIAHYLPLSIKRHLSFHSFYWD